MLPAAAEGPDQRVPVELDQPGRDAEVGDARTPRGPRGSPPPCTSTVARLEVAAELEPRVGLAVQGEQHWSPVASSTTRSRSGAPAAPASTSRRDGRPGAPGSPASQPLLAGVGRVPGRQERRASARAAAGTRRHRHVRGAGPVERAEVAGARTGGRGRSAHAVRRRTRPRAGSRRARRPCRRRPRCRVADPLDVAQRVVEVRGGRRHVGVAPRRRRGPSAPPLASQGRPEVRGVAQPARTQLEPDQPGERLLGGPTGRPAAAYGLAQGRGLRQVRRGSRGRRRRPPSPRRGPGRSRAGLSAARCAGLGSGRNSGSCSADCMAAGSLGSTDCSADSIRSVSMLMSRA